MDSPSPRASVSDIRAALEDDIVTRPADLASRLDEQEIARRFGVSRTPVREALRQLASSGLVELRPNRGAFVRRLSTEDLIQMFEVMASLEALAGGLAARRADRAAIDRIERCVAACAAATASGDPDRYYAENSLFHAAIYTASGNAFLAGEATRLHQRLTVYRRLQLRAPHRMQHSQAEHRGIADAIGAGDASRAETALRDHVAIQGERFSDFIATLGSSEAGG